MNNNEVKIFRYLPENGRLEVLTFESYNEMENFRSNFKSIQDTYNTPNMFGKIREEVSSKVKSDTSYEVILDITKCRLEEVMTNWTIVERVNTECPLNRLKMGVDFSE